MGLMPVRHLLQFTAVVEGTTTIGLLLFPSWIALILLGQSPGTPLGLLLARVAGAALLSLSIACWSVSSDVAARAVVSGVVVAVLLYDVLAAALLGYAGAALGLRGLALWPAVGVHLVLAAWCIAGLRGTRQGTPAGTAQPAK